MTCAGGDDPPAHVPFGEMVSGAGAIYPEEAPVRETKLGGFWIDKTEVTNRDFAKFIADTGYVTSAERAADPDLHPALPPQALVAGSALFMNASNQTGPGRWIFSETAWWRHPEGAGSSIDTRADHPVVHISQEDAKAYAAWAGGRLPTEAEWEYAARGGLREAQYEWGAAPPSALEQAPANIWQGAFPLINTAEDGFSGSAPVGCFPANGYGLYDMTGNVWEWVADTGPNPNTGLLKGGSYLCARNYCRRYRPAARQYQDADFSTNHIGFRLVYDEPPKAPSQKAPS